jgi:hypothetical protein
MDERERERGQACLSVKAEEAFDAFMVVRGACKKLLKQILQLILKHCRQRG